MAKKTKFQPDGVFEHVRWLIAKAGGYVQLCQCDVINCSVKAVRCFDSGKRCECDDA